MASSIVDKHHSDDLFAHLQQDAGRGCDFLSDHEGCILARHARAGEVVQDITYRRLLLIDVRAALYEQRWRRMLVNIRNDVFLIYKSPGDIRWGAKSSVGLGIFVDSNEIRGEDVQRTAGDVAQQAGLFRPRD